MDQLSLSLLEFTENSFDGFFLDNEFLGAFQNFFFELSCALVHEADSELINCIDGKPEKAGGEQDKPPAFPKRGLDGKHGDGRCFAPLSQPVGRYDFKPITSVIQIRISYGIRGQNFRPFFVESGQSITVSHIGLILERGCDEFKGHIILIKFQFGRSQAESVQIQISNRVQIVVFNRKTRNKYVGRWDFAERSAIQWDSRQSANCACPQGSIGLDQGVMGADFVICKPLFFGIHLDHAACPGVE